jgi:hypothetical protein
LIKPIKTIHKTAKSALTLGVGFKGLRAFCAALIVFSGLMLAPNVSTAQEGDDHIPMRIVFRQAEIENFQLAFKILNLTTDKLWPGWSKTTRKTWYVSGGTEFYFCAEKQPKGYAKITLIKVGKNCDIYAKPTKVKDWEVSTATLGTSPPLIIIGSPRRKNVLWMPWVTAWLHEHTHQWQMSMDDYAKKTKSLELSDEGDEGKWMLNYPFPYADPEINRKFDRLKDQLISLLETLRKKRAPARVRKAMYKYLEAKLAFKESISAKDYRYFNFTNWQEGIAKYTEYRAYQVALKVSSWKKDKNGKHPIPMVTMKKMAKMADYNYHKMISDLEEADLRRFGRNAFYATGAIEAIILDHLVKNWRKGYLKNPFGLEWAFEEWFKRAHDLTEADLWKDRDDEATMAWKRFFKNDSIEE